MSHSRTIRELSAKYPCLADFFDGDIKEFLLPDLMRLRNEIRPDEQGKQGCTIPTAMLVFAALDLLGFLMRPGPMTPKERNATCRNISFALSSKANLFPAEYQKNTDPLVHLFRHGIMHQIFPKAAGIAKEMPPNLNFPLIFYSQPAGGLPILNVDRLVDDLLTALALLEDQVCSPAGDNLATLMEGKLGFLHKVSQEKLEEMKKKGLVKP